MAAIRSGLHPSLRLLDHVLYVMDIVVAITNSKDVPSTVSAAPAALEIQIIKNLQMVLAGHSDSEVDVGKMSRAISEKLDRIGIDLEEPASKTQIDDIIRKRVSLWQQQVNLLVSTNVRRRRRLIRWH